jgi:type III secretory pathway lipoprotein EscJ
MFKLNLSMKELQKRTSDEYLVARKLLDQDAPEYLGLDDGDKKSLTYLVRAAAAIEDIDLRLYAPENLDFRDFLQDEIKAGNNWNVQVNSGDVFSALRILDKSRFLKRDLAKTKSESKGFMASKDERQKALERELAMNLEETLEAIPEILEARIHFYFSQKNDFDLLLEPKQKSASILLVVNNKASENDDELKNIVRGLISGAAGIDEDVINITVAKDFIGSDNLILTNEAITVAEPIETDFVWPKANVWQEKFVGIFSNKIFLIFGGSLLGFLALGYLLKRQVRFKKISWGSLIQGKIKTHGNLKQNKTAQVNNLTNKAQILTESAEKIEVIEKEVLTNSANKKEIVEKEVEEKKLVNSGRGKPFRYLNQGLF